MSNLRVKQHPSLGILIGTDGHVMVPATSNSKAHWTFGCKNAQGYMVVCMARKTYKVHRLVAQTFIQYPIPEGYQIDHRNRIRDDNRLENIRIVTPSENQRNTAQHDRVTERGGTHVYEDAKQANRENCARYRAEHPEKVHESNARNYSENRDKRCEYQAQYNQAKRKTHRRIQFSDGKWRWIPHADAILLLAIPLKERHYAK